MLHNLMTYTHQLYIDRNSTADRAALVVDGEVSALHIEPHNNRSVVGNIYRGKVSRVVSAMQAAFVDIGLPLRGFLHRRDLGVDAGDIGQMLHQGQSIVVQVTKAPRGSGKAAKGASLSLDVKLVGRCIVYLPLANPGAVILSNRIKQQEASATLKDVVGNLMTMNSMTGSVILRAGALDNQESLEREIVWLNHRWRDAQRNTDPAPELLVAEIPFALRAMRDLAAPKLASISVSEQANMAEFSQFMTHYRPAGIDSITVLNQSEQSVLSNLLDKAVTSALSNRVSLSNGGELVIESTEAMTVVDVNTASATSGDKLYHQTNLLAAVELARQLRLRNIGGIVIVDFIDTSSASEREILLATLTRALASDSVRTSCEANSRLGLIEITRERFQASLGEQLLVSCEHCDGTGRVLEAGL